MPSPSGPQRLYDPRNGDEAVIVQALSATAAGHVERSNLFSIYWIEAGITAIWADAVRHVVTPGSLLFFVPYQRLHLESAGEIRATRLQFHANFLCVETFHAETGCAGVLFNDTFGSPAVTLDAEARAEVPLLLDRIVREQLERRTAHSEAVVAYLKLLLITASRLKQPAGAVPGAASGHEHRHPVLSQLKDLVETHYRTLHSPAAYALRLHVTAKTLTRIVRTHLGKTMSDVIRERILIHAKWQLLHTLRPVKEIAAELGFDDELYFSRLFKNATGLAPTMFRKFETAIRDGRNLSMSLSSSAIPASAAAADDPVRSPASRAARSEGGESGYTGTAGTSRQARSRRGGGDAPRADRRAAVDRRTQGRKVRS